MSDASASKVYQTENIEPDATVQGRYKAAVLTFYGKQGTLAGRAAWIKEQCA